MHGLFLFDAIFSTSFMENLTLEEVIFMDMNELIAESIKFRASKELTDAYALLYAISAGTIDTLVKMCGYTRDRAEHDVMELIDKAKKITNMAAIQVETKRKEES